MPPDRSKSLQLSVAIGAGEEDVELGNGVPYSKRRSNSARKQILVNSQETDGSLSSSPLTASSNYDYPSPPFGSPLLSIKVMDGKGEGVDIPWDEFAGPSTSSPIDIPEVYATTTKPALEWRAFSPSSYGSSFMEPSSDPIIETRRHDVNGVYIQSPPPGTTQAMVSDRASRKSIIHGIDQQVGEEEEFGEETEHIDFVALKGHLRVFRSDPTVDLTDTKGKYVFYSLQTGLLRHHVLAEIGKRQGVGVKNLSEIMRSGPFWLDICDPTVEELRALCEVFKMHSLTLEGLESEGEDIREKCDVFQKYYFVCIRAFDADVTSDYFMRPINLYMLVSPSCVVTIHRDPLEFSHTIAKRMRLLTARIGLTSDWIGYAILEDVMEMFAPVVRALELDIDSIDDSVGTSTKFLPQSQGELFDRIAIARKRVTQLIRLMSAKSDLLRVIGKRCAERFSDDALLYLRDLQDHTTMVDQTLHHYDELLTRSHSNHLAYLNIEISETSNRMSDVMKKLTAISTVTLPWSMITGLLGMNIFVPGGQSYTTGSLIPWLCLFIAMSTASVLIYFIGRRRDWF